MFARWQHAANLPRGWFRAGMMCGANLCDAINHRCNKCIPNTSNCEGSSTMNCSSDGQIETGMDCRPTNECSAASCSAGMCRSSFKPIGAACAGGKMCDGAGGCTLECLADADCNDAKKACDTTRHTCMAKATCPDGIVDATIGENCDPMASDWINAPKGVCDPKTCKVTEMLYGLGCGGTTPPNGLWDGASWTCNAVGALTTWCPAAGNNARCVTNTGRGACYVYAPDAPKPLYFCAIGCQSTSDCPGNAGCFPDPNQGPTACGAHPFQ
jgi:hypothetical protein